MRACAAMLKENGIRTRWNSKLVHNMMLWGIKSLLFHGLNHPRKQKTQMKRKVPVGFAIPKKRK